MFLHCSGVDIALSGHEHIYERYWPIYNFQVPVCIEDNTQQYYSLGPMVYMNHFFQVKNGSYEEPYTDPGAPVHIVTGAAVSTNLYCAPTCMIINA